MIFEVDSFEFEEGQELTIEGVQYTLCNKNPIEEVNGRKFRPWAAERVEYGDYLPVVEMLKDVVH